MTVPEPPPFVEVKGKKYKEVKLPGDKEYLVRYYEPPPLSDLNAYAQLITDFERRFFRNVDRGHEVIAVTDIDKYIDQKRTAYDGAAEGPEKEMEGNMLCIALIRRAVDRSLQHIQIRADAVASQTTPDAGKLRSLYRDLQTDFMDTYRFPPLRLSRGQPDVDDVLGEMRGEPFNIFAATLINNTEKIEEFYRNRYIKTAEAMQCIDSVTETMQKLDAGRGGYRNLHVQDALVKLADAAKERMQLQRSDPDFHIADIALRSARNDIQDLLRKSNEAVPEHLPDDRKKDGAIDPLARMLTRNAMDLIYDVAMTHDAQNHRAGELAASVESYIQQTKRRGSATRTT